MREDVTSNISPHLTEDLAIEDVNSNISDHLTEDQVRSKMLHLTFLTTSPKTSSVSRKAPFVVMLAITFLRVSPKASCAKPPRIYQKDRTALDWLDRATQHEPHRPITVNNINTSSLEERPQGTSNTYALRKLRKDRPDLHERVDKAGLVTRGGCLIGASRIASSRKENEPCIDLVTPRKEMRAGL